MTQGRKPLTAAVANVADANLDQPRIDNAMVQMRADVMTQHEAEKDEVLAAGIDIGRLEAMDFVLTVSTSAIFSIYENVKKSKAWRLLRNPQSSDGQKFQSLEEFCQVKLGKSYKRLQQMAGNQRAIGQESFEQAERLGLHQRDYNAIKALPAPDQELIRRAVEDAQSRDEVLDLLQELAARHAGEKVAMAKAADESKQEHAATLKRLEVVTGQKEQAEARAARIAVMPPDDVLADLKKEAAVITADAEGAILGGLRQALLAINSHSGDPDRHNVYLAGLVGQVQAQLNALRQEFNLPDVSNAADQQLATEMAEWDKE